VRRFTKVPETIFIRPTVSVFWIHICMDFKTNPVIFSLSDLPIVFSESFALVEQFEQNSPIILSLKIFNAEPKKYRL
jgi:hypothetical protein